MNDVEPSLLSGDQSTPADDTPEDTMLNNDEIYNIASLHPGGILQQYKLLSSYPCRHPLAAGRDAFAGEWHDIAVTVLMSATCGSKPTDTCSDFAAMSSKMVMRMHKYCIGLCIAWRKQYCLSSTCIMCTLV